jgi:hypothetical protein
MRSAEHVARLTEKRDVHVYRFSVGKDKLEDLDLDEMSKLKLILKK